jgi:hypothetical protein
MILTEKNKPYIVGLSFGTLWLIAVSTGFSIYSFSMTRTASVRAALVMVLLVAGTLLAMSIRQIAIALKLPNEPRSLAEQRTGQQIRARFALIFALEIVAIGLVNLACFYTHHLSLMVPLDLIIVGIHFMPLAKLFGVPRYTILGWLFCIASILTLLLVPANAHHATFVGRSVYSSLGCSASALLISAGNLLELRRRQP